MMKRLGIALSVILCAGLAGGLMLVPRLWEISSSAAKFQLLCLLLIAIGHFTPVRSSSAGDTGPDIPVVLPGDDVDAKYR